MRRRPLLLPMLALFAAFPAAIPAFAAATPTPLQAALSPAQRSASNVALDADRHPDAVLTLAGFRPGDVVADYSAGGGYYSEPIATLVGPKGRVYAQVSPRFYKAEQWDAIRAAHPNIAMLVAPDDAAQFAPNSLDALFAHLVFHDLFLPSKPGQAPHNPQAVIANWFAAVRHGGHVIIVDHVAGSGDVTEVAGRLHRINPDAAKAAMTAAGFVWEGESDILRRSTDDHSLAVFAPGLRGNTDRFAYKFRKP